MVAKVVALGREQPGQDARQAHWLGTVWRQFRRSPSALLGLSILVAHLLIAVLSPWLVPYSPTALDPAYLFAPPSSLHLFGTDQYGRDIFTRVLLGGRLALVVASSAALVAVLIGGWLGIWLGYVGGWLDEIVMRLVDATMVLPDLLLILTIITVFGAGWSVILLVLVILYIPGLIRIVRAATLDFVPREFVQAARARGERQFTIIGRELLPNVQDILLVEFAMRVSWSVVAVSGLAFLGFGVPPTTPDWGLMIAENRQALAYAPWCTLFPVLAISTLVIGINLATEGLAKALGVDRTRGAPV